MTRARDARRPGINSYGSMVIVTRSCGSRPRRANSAATLSTVVSDHLRFRDLALRHGLYSLPLKLGAHSRSVKFTFPAPRGVRHVCGRRYAGSAERLD